jgi:hypothetical protein
MEARCRQAAFWAVVLLVSMGAQFRSANFIVETPDPGFAQQVNQAAEKYRRELALEWLGEAMPHWSQPCLITVEVGQHLGAGGATTFVFDHGEVFGWRMNIQGSAQRILDSVLPHEITHMVYASHFRQPLPRWADEGGATSVEHSSERNKHRQMLYQFLRTGRGIAFSDMFTMTEYPHDIMPLYAQGYSLAEFLIQTAGRRKYVAFLDDGLQNDDWTGAVTRHYGVQDLGALQTTWLAWVQQGSPTLRPEKLPPTAFELLALNDRRTRPEPNLIHHVRDKETPATLALVPVRVPNHVRPKSSEAVVTSSMPPAASVYAKVAANRWVDPSQAANSSVKAAVAQPQAKSATIVATGWHVPGAPVVAAASVEPAPVQVAHPQPLQQPRQMVLTQ